MNSFGQRLRTARESAGFTQEKLAERLDISRTAVARWEYNDTEPKLRNLVGIAEILNVSTDFLLGIRTNSGISGLSDEAVVALNQLIIAIKKEI